MSSQPFSQKSNTTLLGEGFVFAFPPRTKVGYADLQAKLAAAGIDPKFARGLATRWAFTRACDELAAKGLLRDKLVGADTITFQLSRRVAVADGIDYARVVLVTLDLTSGAVTCPDPQVEADARTLFSKAMGERKTRDLTRLVERILRTKLNRGVYRSPLGQWFIYPAEIAFGDQVKAFITSLGGVVEATRVFDTDDPQAGGGNNTGAVQTVIVDSIDAAIGDLEGHILSIKPDAGEKQLENAAAALDLMDQDLAWNSRRIGEKRAQLEDYLAHCRHLLERKKNPVDSLPAFKESDCDGSEELEQDEVDSLPEGALYVPRSDAV